MSIVFVHFDSAGRRGGSVAAGWSSAGGEKGDWAKEACRRVAVAAD